MLKHIIPMARASASATATASATNIFILNAGTIQLNTRKYMHKNVNLYKSPEWLYCNVLVHNTCYKRIYAEELTHRQAYDIKMAKCNALPSLLCGDGIVYQRDAWFAFKLEFMLNDYLGPDTTFNNTDGNKVFFEIYLNEINNNK